MKTDPSNSSLTAFIRLHRIDVDLFRPSRSIEQITLLNRYIFTLADFYFKSRRLSSGDRDRWLDKSIRHRVGDR